MSPQRGAADAQLKSQLLRTRSLKPLPLQPGAGQYIATHATDLCSWSVSSVQNKPLAGIQVFSRKWLEARETDEQIVLQGYWINGTEVTCHHKWRRRTIGRDAKLAGNTEVIRANGAGHKGRLHNCLSSDLWTSQSWMCPFSSVVWDTDWGRLSRKGDPSFWPL